MKNEKRNSCIIERSCVFSQLAFSSCLSAWAFRQILYSLGNRRAEVQAGLGSSRGIWHCPSLSLKLFTMSQHCLTGFTMMPGQSVNVFVALFGSGCFLQFETFIHRFLHKIQRVDMETLFLSRNMCKCIYIYILCIHPDLTGEQRCISTRIFRYTVSESFPSFVALVCTPSTSETRATAASTRSNNVTRCNQTVLQSHIQFFEQRPGSM